MLSKIAYFTLDGKKISLQESKLLAQDHQCVLIISVGQTYHEGESLEATIDFINKCQFSSCVIIVADTLQRYTKQLRGLTPEESEKQALAEGDKWVENNENRLKKLNIKYTIIRWDAWISSSEFEKKLNYIEDLYKNKSTFTEAFNKTVDMHMGRERGRNSDLDLDNAKKLITLYVKEELAVAVLWGKCEYHFVVYPKSLSPAMYNIFQQIRSLVQREDILISLTIKFEGIPLPNMKFLNNGEDTSSRHKKRENIKKAVTIEMLINMIGSALSGFGPEERREMLTILKKSLNPDLFDLQAPYISVSKSPSLKF